MLGFFVSRDAKYKNAVKIHRTFFFFIYPSIPSNSAVLK
ncbi:hypothetical protein HMPREF1053_0607 [Haemophilus haemolyticus HK386]|nr:hypothetical protein HMPREF1053_0607 [Haemophilus haemolyticus HK386]